VVDRLSAGLVGGQVAITQLIAGGLLSHEEASISGAEIGERAASQTSEQRLISVRSEDADAEEQASASTSSGFNWLAYMAPSMAILSLMFTVTAGGRTILAEREGGTLSRMLSTPSRAAQVIGGKVLGIFVVGIAQMAILILASYGLFGVRWGSAAGLVLLTLALVAAATGWGMLLAAYCRTPAQAGQLGAVLSLVFAILGGNLFPRPVMPDWLLTVSYITPNAWGLEGYTKLAAGGGLADIGLFGVGLLTMAAVLFIAATLMFRRQYA